MASPDDFRPGRRPKINDEVIEAASKLLREGQFRGVVAKSLGISAKTFWDWMKKGSDPEQQYDHSLYVRFRNAVLEAESEAEIKCVRTILFAGLTDDPKYLQWYLECKYPRRYGKYRGEMGGVKKDLAALEKLLDELTAQVDPGQDRGIESEG